jgi:hypothetical protein
MNTDLDTPDRKASSKGKPAEKTPRRPAEPRTPDAIDIGNTFIGEKGDPVEGKRN